MKTELNIVLKMPAVAKGRRVTVLVYGKDDELLATDEGNLMSLTTRKNMVARLAEKLQIQEQHVGVFREQFEAAWMAFYQDYQRQTEAGPAQESAAELLAGMPEEVRLEAESLVDDPHLLDKVQDDLAALGVAGERRLASLIYLVGVSRLLERPLSCRVHGPSTSGKSYVINKVADLFPTETMILATQMTPQALYHMPEGSLVHRFIVAGERSRLENDESAEATRALREMISGGKLSKLMPVKIGGQMETMLIKRDGPIAFIESTTLAKVFDEDANRCLTLYTDERPEQTRRIIQTLAVHYEGHSVLADTKRIIEKHHAMQRLLQSYPVVIPYAGRLGELLDDQRVEMRRAFPQIISMVQAVALLHQYQRDRDAEGRLVANRMDYVMSRRLLLKPMTRLLGGGLSDPARRFLDRLRGWAKSQPFTSTEARSKETHSRAAVFGWLKELNEAGMVKEIAEGRGSRPATWELTGKDSEDVTAVLPSVDSVCVELARAQ
jgi:hypothetical protein